MCSGLWSFGTCSGTAHWHHSLFEEVAATLSVILQYHKFSYEFSYDVVNPRASKRPVSTDRETAHISRIITNAKVIIMASWEFGEMSSVAVSMDVFSPFSRLRRSVKWLYYDCNRLTKSLASTGSQVAISKKMKGRFPRERTRFSTMMGGRPLFSI